jgi:[ribosomal protein S5]-alanine N-acetyltransferase
MLHAFQVSLTEVKTHRILEEPSPKRRDEFLAAVKRSRRLHNPWVYPPATRDSFSLYLKHLRLKTRLAYFICTEGGELAGVINISEIVRGSFCSAYLGYYAFAPHDGHGYMKRGLNAVLREAFSRHRLHRLEANIQPGNTASRALAQAAGFRLEGFSPRYLKIGGRWRDHERWAITVEEWRARARDDGA